MKTQPEKQAEPTETKTPPRTATTRAASEEPAAKRAKHESVRNNMHTEQKRTRAEGTDQMRGPPEDTVELAGQKAGQETFRYVCPACQAPVRSAVRTGEIEHRRACGNRFRVKDGHVDEPAQPTPRKTQPRAQTTQAAQAVPVAKRAKHVSVSIQVRTDHKLQREQEPDKGRAPTENETGTNAKARTVPAPPRNSVTEGGPTTHDDQRADAQARPQQETQATARAAKETNAAPAKVPGRKAGEEMFQYACPFCAASVSSSVRTGQIDHRRACGHRFRVKDGDVAARKCDYVCPFCKGQVASNLKTRQINHRTVCGNQFYVKEGTVSAQTRQRPQRCPACHSVVWSTLLFGRIQAAHNTPSGKQCPTKSWRVPESKRDTTK